MNVNGARFHLILGGTSDAGDWGACLTAKGATLATKWSGGDASLPCYDRDSGRLTLLPLVEQIPDTPGEPRFTAADTRAAAADRNGNLYVVSDDRRSLLVRSAGDGRTTQFWPPAGPRRPSTAPVFADVAEDAPSLEIATALTTTAGDFLVAGIANGAGTGALLRFDLIGGGPPERVILSDNVIAAALSPSCEGGLWLRDANAARLLKFDRDLVLETRHLPGDAPTFAAVDEEPGVGFVIVPVSIDIGEMQSPAAVATLEDGSVLLLDAPTDGPAALFVVDVGADVIRPLIQLDFAGTCLLATTSATITRAERDRDATPIVLVADAGGNRARQIALKKGDAGWAAEQRTDTLPLRRFGGRALVELDGKATYDTGASDPSWVPVVEISHRRYAGRATFLTPILDGIEPQCVWDRLRLDGCIPPGAAVIVEARAADLGTLAATSIAGWVKQPALVLSPEGAATSTDAALGRGSWQLLLQNVVGRYAQLRVTLIGNARVTPTLRALRMEYPRFSYVERFLPAIYREAPGGFLERFLANFEGVNTAIEDRIATAEMLFDPRIAPAEMIDWLASWFDVALDPAWDERRRRLFVAHAARFFGWRGTIGGLGLALKLALDETVQARDFDLETPFCQTPRTIRIVEDFASRRRGRVFPPGMAAIAPGARSLTQDWIPEEGPAGLWARWPAAPAPSGRFPLFPPDGEIEHWTKLVDRQFGFVPTLGQGERRRWQAFQNAIGAPAPVDDVPEATNPAWERYAALPTQDRSAWQAFLRARYRTSAALRLAHGVGWDDFALVPLPDHLPGVAAAARDWLMFEGQHLPIDRSAHRFSVLLPRTSVDTDPDEEDRRLALARRIIALEKPAHTVFDVRFYWAMNRIGEARLGLDSAIGQGSRALELVPGAVLGRAYIGATFVGGPDVALHGRERIAC